MVADRAGHRAIKFTHRLDANPTGTGKHLNYCSCHEVLRPRIFQRIFLAPSFARMFASQSSVEINTNCWYAGEGSRREQ